MYNNYEKVPPHDNGAEAGIICTLITHPEFEVVSENLQPNFFYFLENAKFYGAIKELFNQGVTTIDELTLITQLTKEVGIEKELGINYKEKVKKLVDGASLVSRSTPEEYKMLVNKVIGLGFKRKMIAELSRIQNKCFDATIDDISNLNAEVMDIMNNMASDYLTGDKIESFGKKVDNLWEEVKAARNSDGSFGIKTCWNILDKYFTYQEGELILFVARRKQGKSVIAMNETLNKAKAGLYVVYFDTEMSDKLFFTRLASHASGIEEDKIKSGNLTHEEEQIVEDTINWIKTLPIIHEYRAKWTREDLVTQCKILKNKGMCDFFIYDYIKNTNGKVMSASEQSQELGIWCNCIKNEIAGALNIPAISFAQLNRGMSIADSDGIERYCTAGVMWQRKSKDEILEDGQACGNYKMKILFNRIGDCHDEDDETDYLDFLFRGSILTINECATQHEREENPFEDDEE